jgi:hypothetical protein
MDASAPVGLPAARGHVFRAMEDVRYRSCRTVQEMPDGWLMLRKLSLSIACLGAMLASGGGAAAGTVDDLYRAQTIVTRPGGGGPGSRLRRVSGTGPGQGVWRPPAARRPASRRIDRTGGDVRRGVWLPRSHGRDSRPRRAGLARSAFDLTVSFDRAKIGAALRVLRREPWRAASRPRLVVFLGVRIGPTSYVLASDGERGRDQRDALAAAAERFGMPTALPDRAALAGAGLGYEEIVRADPSSLEASATKIGGDLALVGSLAWSEEALGWVADWRLAPGSTYRWQIRGVSFDKAFRAAMAGAAQILSGHGQPG